MLLWCWSVDSIVNGKSWKLVKMPWSYHIFMFMYSRCINALIYPMFLSRAKHVCVSMFVGTQGVHIPCHILLRRPKPTVTAKLWKHDIACCSLKLACLVFAAWVQPSVGIALQLRASEGSLVPFGCTSWLRATVAGNVDVVPQTTLT